MDTDSIDVLVVVRRARGCDRIYWTRTGMLSGVCVRRRIGLCSCWTSRDCEPQYAGDQNSPNHNYPLKDEREADAIAAPTVVPVDSFAVYRPRGW